MKNIIKVLPCILLAFILFVGCANGRISIPINASSMTSQSYIDNQSGNGNSQNTGSNPAVSSAVVSNDTLPISVMRNENNSVISSIDNSEFKNAKRVPILLYHHLVSKEEYNSGKINSLVATTENFESHIKELKDNGYSSVTADQLIDFIQGKIKLPQKSVCITFDDGYKANAYYAAPILKKYGYTATVFVITKFLEKPHEPYSKDSLRLFQYVSYDDIKNTSDVINYQCHSYDLHVKLLEVPAETIKADLKKSKKLLDTKYFAYPINGTTNKALRDIIKSEDFVAAFSNLGGYAKPGDDLFAIPRITILSSKSATDLMEIIEKDLT